MECVENEALEAKYQEAMSHVYGDEDYATAARLLEEAAEEGHREAAYQLAICYHYGYGVEKDLKTAYQLYLRSALQGYGKGLNLVGDFYAQGLGVRQSWREAIKWYLDATVSDDLAAVGYAQWKLAGILARGDGVEQDVDGAIEWYNKALSNGELRAKEELEQLGQTHCIRIREARAEDAPAIWQMAVMKLGCQCSLEELQNRLTQRLEQDFISVAVLDGKTVGFVHARDLDTLLLPQQKQILSLAGETEEITKALRSKVQSWAGEKTVIEYRG